MFGPTDIPAHSHPAGTVRSFGELISVVPLLLGFRPVDSLVLLTHTTTTSTVSGVIRVDLPTPHDQPALLGQLREVAVTGAVRSVTVVVVGGGHIGSGGAPHRGLFDALAAELRTVEVTVQHAVWAPSTDVGARWVCYDGCRCSGAVPPMDTSSVATGLVVSGAIATHSREDLVATLAADPDDQLQRRAAMLDTRLHSTTQPPDPSAGYNIVRDAIAIAANSPALPELTDTQIVDLAAALADPQVRDHCLTITLPTTRTGTGSGREDAHEDAAERLWTALTRAVPAPMRAEPAVLLAVHTHLRGRGVLAGIALDIARDANPNHTLAKLLHLAIQHGLPPTHLEHLLQTALTAPRDSGD